MHLMIGYVWFHLCEGRDYRYNKLISMFLSFEFLVLQIMAYNKDKCLLQDDMKTQTLVS